MTQEQAQYYADTLHLSLADVWALFSYWQAGGP